LSTPFGPQGELTVCHTYPSQLAAAQRPSHVRRHLQSLDNEEQRAKITDVSLSKERRYMERHKTIAAHYRFIFRQLFDCSGFPKVIVLEVRLQLVLSCVTHRSMQVQPKYMRAHLAHLLRLSTAALFGAVGAVVPP
jgi:hypothetical protein